MIKLLRTMSKKWKWAAVPIVLIVLVVPLTANALFHQDFGLQLISGILNWVLRGMSAAFALLMGIFVLVAQWDMTSFFGHDTGIGQSVDTVWRLVRDMSNLFFIIVLMVIAFATMLKLENYKWQRLLPKLLAMAILINFSKTISLIVLDLGQVIMMTFTNAVKDVAVDNLVHGLSISKIYAMGEGGVNNRLTALAAQGAMAAMLTVATFVMFAIAILLIARIVIIWLLVALSPVAYLANILDITKRYSTKWWSFYLKNVFLGPFLMFFMWFVFLFQFVLHVFCVI